MRAAGQDDDRAITSKLQHVANWHSLVPNERFGTGKSLRFYKLQTDSGSAAFLVVLDLQSSVWKLVPFFNQTTATTSDAWLIHHATVAVNGGFFNLSNGQSTSYVVVDGKNQCDPKENKALVENPKLKPYLSTIFNRSELRILKDAAEKTKIEICKHNDPILDNAHLESSIQAGPQILPKLTDKEEAFVRTNPDGTIADSIGSNKPAARTACGITPDGYLMLLCVASKGQDEFSSGVTLPELQDILQTLGCELAINFDGGTSTTMAIGSPPRWPELAQQNPKLFKPYQVCGTNPEKLVKSGLMIISLPSADYAEHWGPPVWHGPIQHH